MDAISQNIMTQSISAMTKQQSDSVTNAAKQSNMPQNIEAIEKAAQELESVFVSEMLGHMTKGIEIDPMFGGGQAEDVYRSMLNQEYGKIITEAGGIGLADSLKAEMIKLQEGAL